MSCPGQLKRKRKSGNGKQLGKFDKACHCATEGEAAKVKVPKVKQERKRKSGNGKQLGKFDKAHHCATEGEAVRVKLMKLKVSPEHGEIEEIESEQSET